LAAQQQQHLDHSVHTGADGSSEIGDLRLGAYLLTVSAQGYSKHWQELVVSDGDVSTVEIRLEPLPGALAGKITSSESGAPLAGAFVELGSSSTETDDAGKYSFRHLSPGMYVLRVNLAGYQVYEASVEIHANGSETLDVSLEALRASVVIRVVDATTGAPIENAMIGYASSDDVQRADYTMLVPLKRSRAYGSIRRRVADLHPIDAWQQDDVHFFVFQLRPKNGSVTPEPPTAVFAVHAGYKEPLSALVVTPQTNGGEPEIMDLRPLETFLNGSSPAGS